MPRFWLSAFFLLGAAMLGRAADARPLPKGLPSGALPTPPRFATIAGIDNKTGVVLLNEMVPQLVPALPAQAAAGDARDAAAVRFRLGFSVAQKKFDVNAGRVYDATGAIIKPADLWKGLKVGAVVLVSADGKRVHSTFRNPLKEDALIFVAPVTVVGGLAPPEKK